MTASVRNTTIQLAFVLPESANLCVPKIKGGMSQNMVKFHYYLIYIYIIYITGE